MGADTDWLLITMAAVIGLLIGSFLNVCIYRIPRDISVVVPRSFCPECGAPIHWYDNLPLLSFVLLRGRCRACSKSFGLRYITVELATAVAFAAAVARFGITLAALKCAIFQAILIVLFWTDLEERILPDELTFGGIVAGALFAWLVPLGGGLGQLFAAGSSPVWISAINAALGAALLSLPVWVLGAILSRIRNRDALGLGDVKLLACIGVFLGPEAGLSALLIATVGGSIIGILYVLISRKSMRTYELPFGSFLCAGAAIAAFLTPP